ncbi:Hypothetical predicted protein [Octopus vulgaris]|uniref:Uncharacterized protein n=1 Tax=Octopus vulgaris TaxID=6645 RepID=A0AA36BS33_OCTVU|nr:Hypothetical predicted protein [Octopus vulgaris]
MHLAGKVQSVYVVDVTVIGNVHHEYRCSPYNTEGILSGNKNRWPDSQAERIKSIIHGLTEDYGMLIK